MVRFCAEFFAKSIGENRNNLAFLVWELVLPILKKLRGGSRNVDFFPVFVQQFSRQLLDLKIV